MAQEHHIFFITEILEAILLHTDNVTLLTSAQRVCRHWHRLIKDSHALQCALFFKPTNKPYCLGQKRIQNPLIEENLWPRHFRKELRTRPRGIMYKERQFPAIDAAGERAYLYVKASWKRMFTHQPPTSHIGIIETGRDSKKGNHFSQLVFSPKGGFIRLEHLDNAVDSSTLMPGEEPLVFWYQARYSDRLDYKFERERKLAVSKYLIQCDLVIFCRTCILLDRPQFPCTALARWLYLLREEGFSGHFQEPIRDD